MGPKKLVPFRRGPPSQLNHLPQAPHLLTPAPLGVRILTFGFGGGGTDVQTTVGRHSFLLVCTLGKLTLFSHWVMARLQQPCWRSRQAASWGGGNASSVGPAELRLCWDVPEQESDPWLQKV